MENKQMPASDDRIDYAAIRTVFRAILATLEARSPGSRAAVEDHIIAVADKIGESELKENQGDAERLKRAALSYL